MASEIEKTLRYEARYLSAAKSCGDEVTIEYAEMCLAAADHIKALETAAKAVIAQWDTPNWKLTEPTAKLIEALRAVVSPQPSGGPDANQ
ncbi:hypothetical protein [Rhizobium hidalgonense]|uniref:hypothetical protein n=1 Tax=Rhizobium hidalgonense TaxID=1538159 RepID=UPI0028713DA0|nr:hypothetical protein [Rhizobium hidalgonense]MDR9813056.1 hypothetical protein [Rhizobium hidalgonense]